MGGRGGGNGTGVVFRSTCTRADVLPLSCGATGASDEGTEYSRERISGSLHTHTTSIALRQVLHAPLIILYRNDEPHVQRCLSYNSPQ